MNNVYRNKISVQRMVLFFKIDSKKKLRMLYCTNFKAQEVNQVEQKVSSERFKFKPKGDQSPISTITSKVKILEDKVDETLCA